MAENKENAGITRYKWEYKNFLEFVKKGKISRAVIYAKALKIDRRTYTHWLQQDELRDELVKQIDTIVDSMEKAGSKDWKMHRELLNMLGVDNEKSIDLTTGGQPMTSLVQFVGDDEPNSNN